MKTGNIREVCEHYSHALRSPLGVALGVVNDLLGGYEVNREDLQDAKSALERIRGLADELRDGGFDRRMVRAGSRNEKNENGT